MMPLTSMENIGREANLKTDLSNRANEATFRQAESQEPMAQPGACLQRSAWTWVWSSRLRCIFGSCYLLITNLRIDNTNQK